MGRGRARRVALAIAAAVLLAATAVLVASAAPAARPLKYACASDLYNAKDVLHYVARPSKCAGSGHTLVNFTKPGLVYTCRKKHGTPHGTVPKIARSKRGIRPYGPAGLMRKVSKLDDCKPPTQPNETPVTLPAKSRTYYCAAKHGGELRWVKKPKDCDRKEFAVVLRKRTAADTAGGTPIGQGEVLAHPDTGATDKNRSVSIGVLANDSGPSGRSLTVASTDTTGTAGAVSVNPGATSITYNPNGKFQSLKPGQTATDTFKYRATDGPDTSAPATVTVTITGANGAPAAGDDSAGTDEDHATSFTVLGNDSDPDGDTLHVGSLDLVGTQGSVTVAGDDSISYDPNGKFDSLQVGQTATDSFKYRATDGSSDSNAATVTVTISGRNDAPVLSGVESSKLNYFDGSAAAPVSPGIAAADPDNANLHAATVTIASGFDSTHDTLEFTNQNGITGSFAGGTLTLTGDASKADYQTALRSVGFQSTGGASGDRSVTFRVDDGSAASNLSNVVTRTVTVDQAPHAVDDSKTVDEDSGANTVDVRSNDTDSDGGPKKITAKTDGSHGTVAITNSGDDLTYTPAANYSGSDSFTYTLNGGSTATVSVTVTPVDDPPTAAPDSATVGEDSGATAVDVLSNDTDIDGGTKEITATTDGTHGTVTGTGGTAGHRTGLTYQPNADYCGSDSFTYTLNGGSQGTVSITVTCVNDAPVTDLNGIATAGFDTTASFTEDSPAASVAPNADLSDVDSANLASATITITNRPDSPDEALGVDVGGTAIGSVYNPSTGVLALSGNDTVAHYQQVLRTVTYSNSSDTPDTANRSVTVKVNDGALDSNTATSTVSVGAHNDAPTATDASTSTDEDTATAITLAGTDPEGDTLTFSADSASAHGGTITGMGSSVTYTPAADYCGTDSFDFTVNDGNGGTDTGTITVTVNCVNDAPVVTVSAGSATYTEGGSPVPFDPNVSVSDVDDATLSGAVVAIGNNFSSADGDTLSMSPNPQNGITATYNSPGPGFLTLSGNASVADYQAALRTVAFSLTSDNPSTATRGIQVQVTDPHGSSSVTQGRDMNVNSTNDAPTADSQSTSTSEDNSVGITLTGSDPEGSALTYASDQPAHGSVSPSTGASVTYTPDSDYCGSDSFTFHTNDGTVDSANGTVSITVNCVNDAPVTDLNGSSTAGLDTTASFTEDSPAVSVAPNADLSDVDSANLASATITITNRPDSPDEALDVDVGGTAIGSAYNPSTGVLALSGTDTVAHYQQVLRSVKYDNTADAPDTADRSVTVKVNDGALDSNTATSVVSVTPHNDAPTATDASTSTSEDTAAPITLAGTDPDGDTLTFTADSASANGGTITGMGSSVTYTPAADYCGTDSFDFTVDDGNGGTDTGTVTVTVNCVNDAPVVDLNGGNPGIDDTASFTEDAGAVALAPSATVSDADNDNLASATVTLTNIPDTTAESLAADVTGTSITADTYDSSTGVLFLHGSDTKAHYQQVLQSVVYDNSSQNPDTADRLVDFKVNDGVLDSAVATSTVSVARANDAPTAADQSVTTDEDTAAGITLSGSDVDGDAITYSSGQPAHGAVTPSTGTSVTYTPDADYCGSDSFTFHTNDGTVDSANGTVSITVSCVNDAPVVDLNGAAAGTGTSPSFAEQIAHTGGATTLAPNGTISDVDDDNLESLTVTLTNHPDGASEFLTADTSGTSITADAYDSSTGVLLLHGTDTVDHYQQVLQTVGYENDATPPNSTSRTVDFVANDGDLDSNTAVSTVSIVPLNAPPVTDLNGTATPLFDTNASFTEDAGPTTLAPSADVTDADDPNLASATITLTNRPDGGAESLSASVAGTSITADAYVPATGVLFLHGSDTVAHYQQVLRTIAYDNTSNTPDPTDRSVTFKTNDGQDDSNVATDTVSVTAHNDAPTATDQSVSTNEDTGKMITLSGTDPENDSLTFTYDSASANGGTITGMAPGVTYTPPADFCGPDSFNFQADDGNGGTDTGTISITVVCANDAPVVDLNGGAAGIDNSAAFTEDQPAVTLATGAVVSDVDNANLASATVTLANHPDGSAEGLTAVTSGTSITADAYDAGTGVLFLHGSDTQAHYQQVLRSVAYNNTSNTPDPTNRTVNWKANDGSLDSATAVTTLTVTPANDPPALDLNGGGAGVNETASYTEDQPATTLAPNTLASDPDNADLQSATVTLTNHPDGGLESLSVDTSGTSITPVAYNSGTGVLSLSGSDTVAHYQQVLRTVKYLNTSQNANTTSRVVNFVVNDGSSNSNSPTVSVTITVVNDPPVVDLNGGGGGIDSSAAFTEDSSPTVVGSGPVSLGSSATVSDVDNTTLSSATLTVTNHPDGVNESLSVTIPGGNPITTGGYNASTGVLQLTGNGATAAQFQTVIQSAKYNNVSNTPDPTNRDVAVKVNDGNADSTVAHTTITVTPTNDAPVAGDETFNSTNSAVGNTTLNVNDTNDHGGTADGRPPTPDPTDTSPTTDRPHKTITGDIIANDTDPESPNSDLTVTPGTFATNDGGTVTIQSDGDFNFEPAPSTSCTDHSDFFDYTVTDNNGTDTGTDTGRVTVATTGCVWYVNNNDAQGNSGTAEKPYDTIAQAQTASSANQTIFIYDGDDTTTGYDTGFNMKSGQTLESEGADLVIGSDTLHAADAANKASIKNLNADVVSLNDGATVKSLNIDPQGTGGGICGGTACGGNATAGSTLDDVTIQDNGTKGTQPGLELNGTTGTFNISNLTVNNGDGSSATTGDEGVKLNAAGTVNFASTGTISLTTNGAKALDATAGTGTTSLGSASTFDDITVTNSSNGGVLLDHTTGSGTQLGDASGTDLNLTTVSGSQPAFSIQTSGSVTVPSTTPASVATADVHATGGPAVDIVSPGSPGSSFSFDDVDSTNSANDGVNLDGMGTSTFSATSGDIGGEAGIGFDLNGGSGGITYGTFGNCAFANGSGPLVAEVTGRTGGVVSIPCNMFDTNDAGGGINESGNTGGSTVYTGATKQFNTGASDALTVSNPDGSTHTAAWAGGGTAVTTTTGTGVNGLGVGPTADGNLQFSGTGNTIDSGSGRSLNVTDVNVNTTGVNFDHISGNGAGTSINLSNTGTNKALTVTGTGGTCTSAATCTGGTIQNDTGKSVVLNNVPGGLSLSHMLITAGADDGINGTTVGGFAMDNSTVSSNGNASGERGLEFSNLTGTVTMNTDTVSGNAEDGFQVANDTGTMSATVTNGAYSNQSTAGIGNDGIQMVGSNSANETLNIQGSTFATNRGDHVQVSTGGGSPTQDVTINSTTMTSPASGILGGGITISPSGGANVVDRITNNSIGNSVSSSVNNNFVSGTGTLSARVTGNSLSAPGADEVQLYNTGNQTVKALIDNNTMTAHNFAGIDILSGDGDGSMNVTATRNTILTGGTNAFAGIYADMGTTSPNANGHADQGTSCLDIGGAGSLQNSVLNSHNATNGVSDIRLRHRFNTTVQLPGYTGAGIGSSLLSGYLVPRNSGNGAPSVTDSSSGTNGWTNSPAGAACPQPAP